MPEPTRTPLLTEERGEPSLIFTRHDGGRFQLVIVDRHDEPHRTLVYDLTPDRSLQLARNFLNDGVR